MGQEKYEVWFAGIRGLGARKKYLLHEALKSCRNAYYIEETQLKKFPFLLPLAWLIRILKFGKELYRNNHKKLTGALKTGNRRIELMKKYKIIK